MLATDMKVGTFVGKYVGDAVGDTVACEVDGGDDDVGEVVVGDADDIADGSMLSTEMDSDGGGVSRLLSDGFDVG